MISGWKAALAALSLVIATPAAADTLRWASAQDVTSFDPNSHRDTFTMNVLFMTYDGLVRRNKKLEIEPALATSWETVAPDRWRFKLRQGVKFHGGQDFSADDVVTSVKRAVDPASRNRGLFPFIVDAEKVDAATVDIILKGPYPLLLNDLVGLYIMSDAWLREHGALAPGNAADNVTTFASTNVNGTGPFKLKSYQADTKISFEANKDWWDTPDHNLTAIDLVPIKSSATRVAALLSGEVDFMTGVPVQDISRISSAPGYRILEQPGLRVVYVGFNWRPELLAAPGEKNPLLDLRVRQALWHAVDLEAIRDKIMRGKSRVIGTMIAPPVTGYSAEIDKPLAYDPELAKRLLAEAGYPDGFKTGFACANDLYLNNEQICIALASMWARVGVKADLTIEPRATYAPKLDRGETDMWVYGSAALPQIDGFNVVSGWLATRSGAFGGLNPNGLSSPAIDDLTAKAAVELDEAKRQDLLKQAFKIAHDEVMVIPLHQQPIAWAASTKVDVPQFPDEYVRPWYIRFVQ